MGEKKRVLEERNKVEGENEKKMNRAE